MKKNFGKWKMIIMVFFPLAYFCLYGLFFIIELQGQELQQGVGFFLITTIGLYFGIKKLSPFNFSTAELIMFGKVKEKS